MGRRKRIVGSLVFALLAGAGLVLVRVLAPVDDRAASTDEASRARQDVVAPPMLERFGTGLPRAGQWRQGFAVVDFDGDGRLDVVHGPPRKSGSRVPVIFSGDGAGNFRQHTGFEFPDLPLDYGDVAVADFDGDGALDVAVAVHLRGLAVLVRRGTRFVPYGTEIGLLGASDVAQGALAGPLATFSSRALEVVDWNGDGRMDLVASSDGPRPFEALRHGGRVEALRDGARARHGMVILLGKDGGFDPVFPANDVPGHGDSLAIADIAPSPGPEIVAAANVVGSKYVVYEQSDAGLVRKELSGMPDDRIVRVVGVIRPKARQESGPRVLVGGVAKGAHGFEGSLDEVQPKTGTSTRLYRGQALRGVSAIGVGDLDGDGDDDVVFGDEVGTLRVLLGEGEGFGAVVDVEPDASLAGCSVAAIVLANVDGAVGDEVFVSYAGDDGACPSSGGMALFRVRR